LQGMKKSIPTKAKKKWEANGGGGSVGGRTLPQGKQKNKGVKRKKGPHGRRRDEKNANPSSHQRALVKREPKYTREEEKETREGGRWGLKKGKGELVHRV